MNDSPTRLLVLGPSPTTVLSQVAGVARDLVVDDAGDDLASYPWVLLTQGIDADTAARVAHETESRRDARIVVDLEHLPSREVLARLLPGRSCRFERMGALRAVVLSRDAGVQLDADDLRAIGAVTQPLAGPADEGEVLRAKLAVTQAQVHDLNQRLRNFRDQIDGLKERVGASRRNEAQLRERARGAEARVERLEGHPAVRVARRLRRLTRPA